MGRFADTHRIFYKKGEVIKFLSFHLFCKLAIILGQAIIAVIAKQMRNDNLWSEISFENEYIIMVTNAISYIEHIIQER